MTGYAEVKAHCAEFQDMDSSKVVSLDGDMQAFAQRAGGKAETYYAKIIDYGEAVSNALQTTSIDQAAFAKDIAGVDALIKKE